MNRKIAEWYIRNKTKIMFVIVLIIIVVIISLILNLIPKKTDETETTGSREDKKETINNNFNTITMESADSVLSGDELTDSQINMAGYIEKFTEYCNSKNINEAYNMLSNECKEAMYDTVESFTNNYYNKVFGGNVRKVSVENWSGNIYKVEFTQDFLATGVYSEGENLQDYISVIQDENGEGKLNINGYIGKKDINKSNENNLVSMTVLRSDTYMDYQTYTFRVTNKTSGEVKLDDRIYTDSMYLEDDKQIKYGAYSQEISDPELTLSQNETKEITIKFYNKYGTEKDIKKVVFLRIAPNYKDDNSNAYENTNHYEKLEINLD